MRKMSILAAVTMVIGLTACERDNNPEQNLIPKVLDLKVGTEEIISNSNDFGIELFTKSVLVEDDNLMLSPLSAGTALTMLLNGCGGETYEQLKGTLNYPAGMSISEINEAYQNLTSQLLTADPKVTMSLANAIFYKNGFSVKSPFLSVMSTDFNAQVKGLDFELPIALTTINKWASDNTKGKIPKVLDEISGDAVMFIMNALYFKGDWSFQFDKAKTEARPFTLKNGEQISVSTMNGEIGAKITSGSGYKAIEMPYGRTNFTMIAIVPDGSVASFCSSFTENQWNSITGEFDNADEFAKTIVYMPKFKFSYEQYLNQQLKSMGMVDAFEPHLADLSGISDASIFVSFVKQNTFVAVDEEGTEAAAVTTIGVELTSFPPQPRQFVIDKPFVFAIRERTTNTILFIGQLMKPE